MGRFLCFLVLLSSIRLPLRAQTVLVLPFFNRSQSPNLEWIGESIAETLHDSLALEGLLALDREDRLEAYRRLSIQPGALLTRASIIKAADALDASMVIYGEYDLKPAASPASRGSIAITGRAIDLKRVRQGPELSETGALEELAALETHLAWQSLQFLAPKTSPSEEEFGKARPAIRVDAIESYVRGLLASTAEQKHRFFTQAARLDGRYSQPAYQLGRIYWEKKEYRIATGWLERVTRADSRFLEAQFLLGLSRYQNGKFADAAKAFELVASSVPLNEVYNNLGAALSRSNLLPGAADNFRKAVEGDSSDPDYHFNLGYALWKAGQFAAATESFRAVTARNPEDTEATVLLGRCLKSEGPRAGEAKAEGRERLKTNYEETAYRQLKAELESKR